MNMRSRKSNGFTLIEVLVALIVIAIGMLGIAKLQGLALSNTSVSRMRSLAAIEAASLATTMHANRSFWGAPTAPSFTYINSILSVTGTLATGGSCNAVVCTNAAMANADVTTWLAALALVLPNPSSAVTCTNTIIPVSCTIQIQWTETMIGANSQESQVATSNQGGANAGQAITHPTYELYVVP